MARRVAYLVFLIPIVISVPVAAYVLADVVSQPDRKLNLWPFGDPDGGHANSTVDPEAATTYSVNGPTQAKTLDSNFDCGDVYVAAYDPDSVHVTQDAPFDLCFAQNGYVPAGDKPRELPGDSGERRIVLGILDSRQTASEAASVTADLG